MVNNYDRMHSLLTATNEALCAKRKLITRESRL